MAVTDEQDDSGTSRRTVLRAGMHAAWVIPAVQIASQVPALAASATETLGAIGGHHAAPDKQTLEIRGVTVTNNSPSATAAITATVSLTGGGTVKTGTASDWTLVKPEASPISFTASVPAGETRAFEPSLTLQNKADTVKAAQITFSASDFPTVVANA